MRVCEKTLTLVVGLVNNIDFFLLFKKFKILIGRKQAQLWSKHAVERLKLIGTNLRSKIRAVKVEQKN